MDNATRHITESRAGLEGEATQEQIDAVIRRAMDKVEALGVMQPEKADVIFTRNAIELGFDNAQILASNITIQLTSEDEDSVTVTITGFMENELRFTRFDFESNFVDEIPTIE